MWKIDDSAQKSNPFLVAWQKTYRGAGDRAALLQKDGRPLRSFLDIESCASRLTESFSTGNERPIVGVVLPNHADWIAALLAVWRAGGVAVPCEESLALSCQLEGLVGLTHKVSIVRGELAIQAVVSQTSRPTIPEDVDLIKITSGTSSAHRAVAFRAEQLFEDTRKVALAMGICSFDRNLGIIPLAHSYGLTNLFGLLVVDGVSLVLTGDVFPQAIFDASAASGATVFPAVPALLEPLLGLRSLPKPLRLIVSAGAPLPAHVQVGFKLQFGHKIHSFYGASECGGICYDSSDELDLPPGYVGTPMPGIHWAEVSTPEGVRPLLSGSSIGMGYLGDWENSEFSSGKYCPSDLISRSGPGISLVGRVNEVINIGGSKFAPAVVERVLAAHPSIERAVVFGAGEEVGLRRSAVAAAVWLKEPVGDRELRAFCAAHLAAWQVPRLWLRPQAPPDDSRGKASRRLLREELRQQIGGGARQLPSR